MAGAARRLTVRRLSSHGEAASFCDGADPCGHGNRREITTFGRTCVAVAPSRRPRRPDPQVETGQREARVRACLHRERELNLNGVLRTPVVSAVDVLRRRADGAGRRLRQPPN